MPSSATMLGRVTPLVHDFDDALRFYAAVERFLAAGGEPRTEGGATFAHVADLYGNEILLVEMIPTP